jgi:hypothetical protein
MASGAHHIVIHTNSRDQVVAFLNQVVGMSVLHELDIPTELLEKTMGWPPSEGTRICTLGEGDRGLVEVVQIPPSLRGVTREGLAVLSFLTDDLDATLDRAEKWTRGRVTRFDTGVSGVDAALCTVDGITLEFMQVTPLADTEG